MTAGDNAGIPVGEGQTVLLVDDDSINLEVLHQTLAGLGCTLLMAGDGTTALAMTEESMPSLILLDIMMPDMDGYEVCLRLKENPTTRKIPVIFVTALADMDDEAKGLNLGAVDYITKPINPMLVRARVRNHLELSRYQRDLEVQVIERTRQLNLTQAVMIEALATLGEYRDPETGGHIKRTQDYVKALAIELREHEKYRAELTDDTIELLYLSAPLHDVGKIAVPDRILLKPGPLTEDEFAEMRNHPRYGFDALRKTEVKLGSNDFLRHASDIAYTHHEKWDGSGYPRGLKGEDIPLSGRLMAVADVYDALISKRVYKSPIPHPRALQLLERQKGRHFDPAVVDALLRIESTFRNIALTFADFEEERAMLRLRTNGEAHHADKLTALVVDDSITDREIMRNQLTSAGYVVSVAREGREALEMIHVNPPDVILTDIEMPGMDGYELAGHVRQGERRDHGGHTVILAITASVFHLTAEETAAKGFDGYLLKPLDMELFGAKVEAARCSSPAA